MTKTAPSSHAGERIAKVIARAGVCSRRDAERLVLAGDVQVNGQTIDSPALNVTSEDHVVVRGDSITGKEPTRVWVYNKPSGLVTTHYEPGGRPTVFDALPEHMPRVVSVGRLDLNSEGLLVLTNDGALSGRLSHPSTGWKRRYRVRVFGSPSERQLDVIRRGVTIEGVRYAKAGIEFEKASGKNHWYTVTLVEGKNREIRRLFEHINCSVSRLIRISFGPFTLGDMPQRALHEIPPSTLPSLLGDLLNEPERK